MLNQSILEVEKMADIYIYIVETFQSILFQEANVELGREREGRGMRGGGRGQQGDSGEKRGRFDESFVEDLQR